MHRRLACSSCSAGPLLNVPLLPPPLLRAAAAATTATALCRRRQFVREFAKLGLTRSVGGVLALALARELTPVVTAIILAGRVGSAFAAELGTMQVRVQAGQRWTQQRRRCQMIPGAPAAAPCLTTPCCPCPWLLLSRLPSLTTALLHPGV